LKGTQRVPKFIAKEGYIERNPAGSNVYSYWKNHTFFKIFLSNKKSKNTRWRIFLHFNSYFFYFIYEIHI